MIDGIPTNSGNKFFQARIGLEANESGEYIEPFVVFVNDIHINIYDPIWNKTLPFSEPSGTCLTVSLNYTNGKIIATFKDSNGFAKTFTITQNVFIPYSALFIGEDPYAEEDENIYHYPLMCETFKDITVSLNGNPATSVEVYTYEYALYQDIAFIKYNGYGYFQWFENGNSYSIFAETYPRYYTSIYGYITISYAASQPLS